MALYHYVETLTNDAGDKLVGYYVKLKDSDLGTYATLYSDISETPIITVSGIADTIVTDETGLIDGYVADGVYDVEIYDANDANLLLRSIAAIPMFGFDAAAVANANAGAGIYTITEIAGTTHTLAATDANDILRFTNASGCVLTFPPNASVAITTGSTGLGWADTSGTVSWVAGSGVTVNSRDNLNEAAGQGSVFWWLKTDTDEFLVSGDIA
jgi:hypothetical protein